MFSIELNSFDMGSSSKPRLNNSKEDKSPLSSVLQAKKQEVFQISEQAPRSKSNHAINFVPSDPGQKTSHSIHSPKFKTPNSTENHGEKFVRKNSGSNHDQSINCCLICFENQPDAVFMECGHGGMCYTCATDIFKKTGECYLCRRLIKQVLLLDLSQKDGHFYKVKASTRMVNASEEHNTSKEERMWCFYWFEGVFKRKWDLFLILFRLIAFLFYWSLLASFLRNKKDNIRYPIANPMRT